MITVGALKTGISTVQWGRGTRFLNDGYVQPRIRGQESDPYCDSQRLE